MSREGNNVHKVKVMCFVLFCAPGVLGNPVAVGGPIARDGGLAAQ